MKEYGMFILIGALLATAVYGGIYSEVAKAITEIATVIERAGPD